ncbi:MAG: hypothetical protein WCS52_06185 [bacterium]
MNTNRSEGESITAVLIDNLLIHMRKEYFTDFFEQNEKWLTKYGLYGLYAAALVGFISSIVYPIRYELSWGLSLGIGFGWIVACIVSHYVAYRLLPVISNLIKSTPTKLSSSALLDALALLCGIAGVAILGTSIYGWAKTSEFDKIIEGILMFVTFEYLMALCLNPGLLNIAIEEKTTAGQEFIGLLSFFLKGFLKLIPIMFGSWILIGVANMTLMLFQKPETLNIGNVFAIGYMLIAAVLPVVGYLLFVSNYFLIDLAGAVLSVPSKLDCLNQVTASTKNSEKTTAVLSTDKNL